jgi:Secretory lipase
MDFSKRKWTWEDGQWGNALKEDGFSRRLWMPEKVSREDGMTEFLRAWRVLMGNPHRLIRAAIIAASAALIASPPGLAMAQTPANPGEVGDGGVSAFYVWTDDLPATPGRLLRSEALAPDKGLSGAGQQIRILYSSTSGIDGRPIVVSGAIFFPSGMPPEGGWPLVAWAHGTVGTADICAPSWAGRSERDRAYLNAWLAEGYAIVATDYEGLGTPDLHPYLATRPEAYGVLDSARAAIGGFHDIANKVLIIGQSQGAGAAFATAGLASQYAPELNIKGTIATGIPYISARTAGVSAVASDKVDPGIAYLFYLALLAQRLDPTLDAASLFTAKASPLFEKARTTCIYDLENAVVEAGLTRQNTLLPASAEAFRRLVPGLIYPTLKLEQPLFVGTGENDKDVSPVAQSALVKDACAAGTILEAHLYAGLDHSGTVNASLQDSIPFARKVMQGLAIDRHCEPQPQPAH